MSGMRAVVTLAMTVAGLTGCTTSGTAEAVCAAPATTLSTSTVKAGQALTLAARDMWDGCNDQGSNPRLPPLKNQQVQWTQGGRMSVLGTADANAAGRVSVTVTVPVTAKAGPATVSVGSSEPRSVTVTGP
jgi:hypothetical protein